MFYDEINTLVKIIIMMPGVWGTLLKKNLIKETLDSPTINFIPIQGKLWHSISQKKRSFI